MRNISIIMQHRRCDTMITVGEAKCAKTGGFRTSGTGGMCCKEYKALQGRHIFG